MEDDMQQLHLTFKPGVVPGIKALAKETGHKSMNALIKHLLLEYALANPKTIKERKHVANMVEALKDA